jgi:hypothetical protein
VNGGGAGGFAGIDALVGSGSTTDLLVGSNGGSTFTFTGANSGNVDGALTFASFERLNAGSGADNFVGSGGSLTESLSDGGGSATLRGAITTGGTQSYSGAVTLLANTTTTASALTFGSSVDGAFSLTANSSGLTSFGAGGIGQSTALASITTDIAGSTTLGGNVRTTGAISFRDPTNAANRTLASVNNAGIRINVANLASSPNAIDTSGSVTLDGTALGDSGGDEIDFIKTPSSITLTQVTTAFFTGPVTPTLPPIVFEAGSSVTYNSILVAASAAQQQAGQAASAAQGSAAAATVEEANETFGTDSVAEQVEYGFAGDVGTTPPMDHRLEETGISVPACLEESREGIACR